MVSLKYALNEEYTLQKALLWGNFEGHVKAAEDAAYWEERIVHALIASALFLPLISQLASLVEMAVVDYFRHSPNFSLKSNTPLSSINVQNESDSSAKVEVVANRTLVKNEQALEENARQAELLKFERGPVNQEKEMTEVLLQKQQILNKRKLPLIVNPAIPERSYPPDYVQAQRWIDSCEGMYKNLAEKMVNHIQHLSFAQLEENLKLCVDKLNTRFKENKVKEYSVGLVVGKSQQWVASLAVENLDVLPTSSFSLGSKQGTMLIDSYVPEAELTVSGVKEKTLVIFDDSSYTGNQLIDNLRRIDEALKPKIKLFSTKRKLFVVVPFMSTGVKEKLADKKFAHIDFEIITSDISINSMNEVFSREELNAVNEVSIWRGSAGYGRTLCYTDWRFPDGTSTFPPLAWKFHALSEEGVSKYHQEIEKVDEDNLEERKKISSDYCFKIVDDKEIKRPYELKKSLL